ncbi:hypothetical protein B9Z19DRAFT_1096091 [Tuber borchii]|uniref:Uncharacterized protein n=1 Tax=Tuber borchii TaxID=42251 RepID=A0A2T6ZC44_TUBBO|nr:hypothetical protein B9Z19DRAFT_1096091 [Tuber borchii]
MFILRNNVPPLRCGGREDGRRTGGSDIIPVPVPSPTTDKRARSPSGTSTGHNLPTPGPGILYAQETPSFIHPSIHPYPYPCPITNIHQKGLKK